MKTILIANQKGGCGKTLVVDELAFSFDRTDVKYSLYDLDGQGGMLIHKDGKTNLEQMDARTETSGKWIAKQKVTKVLMNPPYENKYGCMKIVQMMENLTVIICHHI